VVDGAAHIPASAAMCFWFIQQSTAPLQSHACGVLPSSGPDHPLLALSSPLTRALSAAACPLLIYRSSLLTFRWT
jgi:hypothetical protein